MNYRLGILHRENGNVILIPGSEVIHIHSELKLVSSNGRHSGFIFLSLKRT